MVKKNKVGGYLLYSIGEIILVVIGILIALQINNWQKKQDDRVLEKRYLNNIVGELKKDSIALSKIHAQLVLQSDTKNPVLEMLQKNVKHDSLMKYFSMQWRPIYPYTPLKSTFEEMKSSSHLNIIRSNEVRESIIKIYNSYESLISDEKFLLEYFKNLVDVLAKNIPNLYAPDINDVLKLGKKPYIMNSIRLNGSYTRRENYKKALDECSSLLVLIKEYQNSL